jgi:rhomboid protease GluP
MVEVQFPGADGEIQVFSYEEFEERVASGRIADDALVRFEPVTGEAFKRAGDLDLVTSLRQDVAHAWQARFTNAGPPILTALLVGVQIRIWLYTKVPDFGPHMAYLGLNWLPPAMENGETWRLLTSGLLHTDFLHILLNMVWLAYTGWNIERALGRVNLAAIFFFSVLSGAVLSMFFTPNVPSLGASGGVYGLVSASVVFGLVRQELLPERGRRLFGVALLPYLVLMFWGGLMNDNTDNWAHFGGLVCGGVLAFVLDPPPFQRRPRQNAMVNGSLAVVSVALLAILSLGGPWLYPLIDKEDALVAHLRQQGRQRVLPPDEMLLEEFTWVVPSGWKRATNTAGDTAFASPPEDHRRSWAVEQVDNGTPLSVDQLAEEWKNRVLRGAPDARVEALEPVAWQGMPAEAVRRWRVEIDGNPDASRAVGRADVTLEFVGTTRGVYGLYRVMEVERDWERWLSPLFSRMDAGIAWREPLVLQAARKKHESLPDSTRARSELAIELARWGEVEEALALQRALVADLPEDPDRWQQLVRIAGWYPEVADADAIYAEALEALGSAPILVVEVAEALRVTGRDADADALLQLAWVIEPGDRRLRRALRNRDLPWTLDAQGLPTELTFLPPDAADGAPVPREQEAVDAIALSPLTIESARVWREQVVAERDRWNAVVAERIAALDADASPESVERAVDGLLYLRDGTIERVPGDERVLSRDLAALEGDRPPDWMAPSVAEALSDPAALAAVRTLVDPPDPEEE